MALALPKQFTDGFDRLRRRIHGVCLGELPNVGVISPRRACEVAITALLTDEKEVQNAIMEVISAIFP